LNLQNPSTNLEIESPTVKESIIVVVGGRGGSRGGGRGSGTGGAYKAPL
jgi:hypothetical protein